MDLDFLSSLWVMLWIFPLLLVADCSMKIHYWLIRISVHSATDHHIWSHVHELTIVLSSMT
jgi:hypothetical protein